MRLRPPKQARPQLFVYPGCCEAGMLSAALFILRMNESRRTAAESMAPDGLY
jgi:hypothetical protein